MLWQNLQCGNFTFGEVEDYGVVISPTLGLDDSAKFKSLQIYPNPASDVIMYQIL